NDVEATREASRRASGRWSPTTEQDAAQAAIEAARVDAPGEAPPAPAEPELTSQDGSQAPATVPSGEDTLSPEQITVLQAEKRTLVARVLAEAGPPPAVSVRGAPLTAAPALEQPGTSPREPLSLAGAPRPTRTSAEISTEAEQVGKELTRAEAQARAALDLQDEAGHHAAAA